MLDCGASVCISYDLEEFILSSYRGMAQCHLSPYRQEKQVYRLFAGARLAIHRYTFLVVEANLNLLFRWGNDAVLGRALQIGEFGHSLLDDIQRFLDFILGNDKRRS